MLMLCGSHQPDQRLDTGCAGVSVQSQCAARKCYSLCCDLYTLHSTAVNNIRISTDILWRVFHILKEPVLYTFISVNRQNNEA